MPRRFFFRTTELELDGFTSGESKSYAFNQAVNNQSSSSTNPVTMYGGEISPRELSPVRGGLADGDSLSVDPPDSADENWRGFLTHFVTPPLRAQSLRAGFLKLAFKGVHASETSTLTAEFSVYVVDDAGEVVQFLYDRDKVASRAFVDDPTVAGIVHRLAIPCRGASIPRNGRLVVEAWTRQIVTGAGTEGIGAEFFLNGADESLSSGSVGSWAEFAQDVLLATEEPVFCARIDPLVGVRHHKIWSTDVIEHGDGTEQRVRR